MKTWEFKIKMSVADSWVVDGFDASERIEEIKESIKELLPYAYGHEVVVDVKVLKTPDTKAMNDLRNGELEPKD